MGIERAFENSKEVHNKMITYKSTDWELSYDILFAKNA